MGAQPVVSCGGLFGAADEYTAGFAFLFLLFRLCFVAFLPTPVSQRFVTLQSDKATICRRSAVTATHGRPLYTQRTSAGPINGFELQLIRFLLSISERAARQCA